MIRLPLGRDFAPHSHTGDMRIFLSGATGVVDRVLGRLCHSEDTGSGLPGSSDSATATASQFRSARNTPGVRARTPFRLVATQYQGDCAPVAQLSRRSPGAFTIHNTAGRDAPEGRSRYRRRTAASRCRNDRASVPDMSHTGARHVAPQYEPCRRRRGAIHAPVSPNLQCSPTGITPQCWKRRESAPERSRCILSVAAPRSPGVHDAAPPMRKKAPDARCDSTRREA